MYLKHLISSLFLLLSFFANGQSIIDSLNRKIENTDNDSIKIELYLQISEINYNNDDYINFKNYVNSVKDIIYSKNNSEKGKLYTQLALFYKKINLYDSLINAYNETANLYLSEQDTTNYIRNKNTEAYTYTIIGLQEKALNILYENIRIAEKINDSTLLSEVYLYLGFGMRQTDYMKAKEYFENSIKYNNDTLSSFYSTCLNEIGNMYTISGNPEKSLPFLERALELRKKTNSESVSYSYNDMAYVYAELGKYYDAILYMHKCIEYEKKRGIKWELAQSYSALGYYYMKAGKLSNSEKYLNISLEYAEKLKLPPIYKDTYTYLYLLYKEKKDYKNALYYYELAENYEDTISENNIVEQIAELEKKYNNEKQEAKLKHMENEKVANDAIILRQRIIGIIGTLLVLLLSIFLYFVFRSRQKSKKANEVLLMQNEEIQQQKDKIEENAEKLKNANKRIADKNIYITDNIKYARKIQTAMLPSQEEINNIILQNFIIYKSKNIVSGDFYTIKKIKDKILIVIADCTGHGVSGAFMSILGMSLINDIVLKEQILNPAEVLNTLRKRIITSLRQKKQYTEATDGMDLAFCLFDEKTKQLQFSGAQISLFIARKNNIEEIKADMMPVGVGLKDERKFKNHTIDIKENDIIYLFTDGYPDQFGGNSGKKFMLGNVVKMLSEISNKPMNIQKNYIEASLKKWQSSYKQVDDILFAGFKFNNNFS